MAQKNEGQVEEVPANVDDVGSDHDLDDMLDDSYPLEEETEETSALEEEAVEEKEAEDEGEDVKEALVEKVLVEEGGPAEVDDVTSLREQLAHLSGILMQHGINPVEVGRAPEGHPQQVPEAKPPVSKTEIELSPLALTKEEFNRVFEEPEHLINLLNRVRESAVEQVLRSIPTVTAKIVNQQTVLNRMVQDFYTANNDLAGVKPFVAVVANEIAARNPGWNVEQVFAEAATESRKRLKLKKEVAPPPTPIRKPGLPKSGSVTRTTSKPQLSKLEQQLEDLM